ncbi:hypothetical protein VTK26DRAFT_8724 [Humicola hyalothermophila]
MHLEPYGKDLISQEAASSVSLHMDAHTSQAFRESQILFRLNGMPECTAGWQVHDRSSPQTLGRRPNKEREGGRRA